MLKAKPIQDDGTPARIAAAAIEVFAEKGYDGASVRDIARRAGLTEGAMYRHFDGKEALAREIFQDNIERWSARLETAAAEAGPGIAAELGAMVRFFCAAFDENRALFAFLLLNQHGPARTIDPERPNPFTVLERRVAEAMMRGEIAPGDPALRTAAILGAVFQPALHVLYRRPDDRLSDHLPEIAAAAIGAAGPTSPSR
jgi:AcrR family transcriptional regulator